MANQKKDETRHIILSGSALTSLLVNKKHKRIFCFKKPAKCIDHTHKNCFNCEWGNISYRRCSYPNNDYFDVSCNCILGYDAEDRAENN